MGKFKARYIVIPLIVLAAGGAVFGWLKVKSSQKIIKVAAVSEAADQYYTDLSSSGETYYGQLRKGSYVNVKVSPELKIKSVNVKKGDAVKKGDVLISYDTHSLSDSVEDAELLVKTITNNMTIIDNELAVLKQLQPSENAPQEQEEEEEEPQTDSDETPDEPKSNYESRITPASVPLMGTGAAEDPFIYMAGQTSVVSKELIAQLYGKSAVFYVCSEDGAQLFAKLIDGTKIDPEKAEDYPLSDGVTITPDGLIVFGSSSVDFASFITMSASPAPADQGDFSRHGRPLGGDQFQVGDAARGRQDRRAGGVDAEEGTPYEVARHIGTLVRGHIDPFDGLSRRGEGGECRKEGEEGLYHGH